MLVFEQMIARTVAEFSQTALRLNYAVLLEKSPALSLLPMVKANGYGHGALWVVKSLLGSNRLAGFGVATANEGIELRLGCPEMPTTLPILVFSGLTPWGEEMEQLSLKHRLTPVLSTPEDFHSMVARPRNPNLKYHLKFNTGMNRLGLPLDFTPAILGAIRDGRIPPPEGVLSHLAMAEMHKSAVTKKQIQEFQKIRHTFLGLGEKANQIRFHLANSSALWKSKEIGLEGFSDWARPGISLYGAAPSSEIRGKTSLSPVLTLKAKILQTRTLTKGDRVGYGARYQAKKKHAMATLGIGYGDGFLRSIGLSKKPAVLWDGKKHWPLLGRVSMDLISVACSPESKAGEWFEILGPNQDVWALAQAGRSVPYELFTSLSRRVERIYHP